MSRIFLSLCVCVCVYMDTFKHAFACVLMCVRLEPRILHFAFPDRIPHWTWSSLVLPDWLARELQKSPSLCTGISGMYCCAWIFLCILKVRTCLLTRMSSCLTNWAILSEPSISDLYRKLYRTGKLTWIPPQAMTYLFERKGCGGWEFDSKKWNFLERQRMKNKTKQKRLLCAPVFLHHQASQSPDLRAWLLVTLIQRH